MGANAQTSVPAFTAGQVLTAAQVTQINTGIPVFATSTERDAAFGGTGEKTLAEGQMAYLEDTNATQYYDGSSWAAVSRGKILQLLSTTKTDTFSTTSTSYVDVTGLSVSITPTATNSNILVISDISLNPDNNYECFYQLVRDSTPIGGGTAVSLRPSGFGSFFTRDLYGTVKSSGTFLDSPASTSALTYKVQLAVRSGGTTRVNTTATDVDAVYNARTSSTITVMEVSA